MFWVLPSVPPLALWQRFALFLYQGSCLESLVALFGVAGLNLSAGSYQL
jgi:hypothetical protein